MLALRRSMQPEPSEENWSTEDNMSMEQEAQEIIWALVRAIKPALVVEIGTWRGSTAEVIGNALEDNDFGQLDTIEIDAKLAAQATKRCQHLTRVRVHHADVTDISFPDKSIGILLLDGDQHSRRNEGLQFKAALAPEAFVLRHDVYRDGGEGPGDRRIVIPTPRGLSITQMP